MSELKNLEDNLKIAFKNKNLLREALTHRSYLNENPSWDVPHNERLEFLGDAVLELIVTENLFSAYPSHTEGELTSIRASLVNYQTLAKVSKDIKLDESIYLSKGEAKDTARAKEVILANAIEALIGAIYLDQSYETVANFVKENVMKLLPEIVEKKLYRDPKSMLQEIIQEKLKTTPTYEVISEDGPDHDKIFEIGVYFSDKLAGTGKGHSKQEAEIEAAKNALQKIGQ